MTSRKTVKLGDVCEFKPKKAQAKHLLGGTDLVSFAPMEMLPVNQRYFTSDEEKSLDSVYSGYTYFEENDVIYAKITPCFENGKLSIAKNLKNGVGFGSSEFVPIRCSNKILPEFLYYYLLNPSFIKNGIPKMTGASGHRRVPNTYTENLEIELLSLDEQRQIVARLDAAFERISAAELLMLRNLDNVSALQKSILHKYLSTDDSTHRLGDVITLHRGYDLPKRLRKPGSYPLASSSGIIDVHNAFKATGPGVFTGRSGSVGKAYYIDEDYWPLNTTLYVKDFHGNNPRYCYWLLKSIDLTQFAGGTGVPTLNRNVVHEHRVSIVDAEKQAGVANKIDDAMEKTRQLESQYTKKLTKLTDLRQSLLAEAFMTTNRVK